jgi:hypothetical protein
VQMNGRELRSETCSNSPTGQRPRHAARALKWLQRPSRDRGGESPTSYRCRLTDASRWTWAVLRADAVSVETAKSGSDMMVRKQRTLFADAADAAAAATAAKNSGGWLVRAVKVLALVSLCPDVLGIN